MNFSGLLLAPLNQVSWASGTLFLVRERKKDRAKLTEVSSVSEGN